MNPGVFNDVPCHKKWVTKFREESRQGLLSVAAQDFISNSGIRSQVEKLEVETKEIADMKTLHETLVPNGVRHDTKKSITIVRPLYRREWTRNNRCDFCDGPDGDLECEICNSIAHSLCYAKWRNGHVEKLAKSLHTRKPLHDIAGEELALSSTVAELVKSVCTPNLGDFFSTFSAEKTSLETSDDVDTQHQLLMVAQRLKQKHCEKLGGNAILGTRCQTNSNNQIWLCVSCQAEVTKEYNSQIVKERKAESMRKEKAAAKVIYMLVLMKKARRKYLCAKAAVLRLQAQGRGYITRKMCWLLLRDKMRPYKIAFSGLENFQLDNGYLSNGWLCCPFMILTILKCKDSEDDVEQLFCYETSVQKIADNKRSNLPWREEFIIPGVDGSALLVFTILSRNGQKDYFLGQASFSTDNLNFFNLDPVSFEIPLMDLAHIPRINSKADYPICTDTEEYTNHFANAKLSLRIQWFSESYSLCGYLTQCTVLRQNQTPSSDTLYIIQPSPHSRWCALFNDSFRVYRHYGLTLPCMELPLREISSVRTVRGRQYHLPMTCICVSYLNEDILWKCDGHVDEEKVWVNKFNTAISLAKGSQTRDRVTSN